MEDEFSVGRTKDVLLFQPLKFSKNLVPSWVSAQMNGTGAQKSHIWSRSSSLPSRRGRK